MDSIRSGSIVEDRGRDFRVSFLVQTGKLPATRPARAVSGGQSGERGNQEAAAHDQPRNTESHPHRRAIGQSLQQMVGRLGECSKGYTRFRGEGSTEAD